MAWSVDSNKSNYNNLIKTKNKHKESLYRDDNLYDLILVINYNMNPVLPNKGSAIFLHVTSDDYKPTEGCVAIVVNDFIEILKTLKADDFNYQEGNALNANDNDNHLQLNVNKLLFASWETWKRKINFLARE